MITQYTTQYSSPSSAECSLISSKVGLLDQYIIMRTGQNETKAIIYDPVTKDAKIWTISRTSGTSQHYTVSSSATSDLTFKVSDEYYVYSNCGVGTSLDLPIWQGVSAYALTFIACVLAFAIVFKGVLFPCLLRSRRR